MGHLKDCKRGLQGVAHGPSTEPDFMGSTVTLRVDACFQC